MLKMKQLSEASGVSAGTIKHYLREGLLGDGDEVVKTSRNMAYYPPEFVERIKLIKQLQEERYMPLAVIKSMLDSELVRAREMVVSVDQPGTDGVDLLGVPVKLSRTPGAPAGPGPALGEHTRDVLAGVGYSEAEIAALLESGAAAEAAGEASGSFLA